MSSDPERAVTLKPIDLGRTTVPAYSEVWVLSRANGQAEIEYQDQRGRVTESVLSSYPVKKTELETLRRLDSCFGLKDEAFVCEYSDYNRFFEILKCKAHQRLFLRDTRGTIAWYVRLTLLRDDDDGSPTDIWSKYHEMSDAELLLAGRTV